MRELVHDDAIAVMTVLQQSHATVHGARIEAISSTKCTSPDHADWQSVGCRPIDNF